MNTRIKMLKVKIKTLAEEAKIIRLEEHRAPAGSQTQHELHYHRTHDVRIEQRNSMIAYAFLRGVPRHLCEPNAKTQPDWKRVEKMVEKFGALHYSDLPAQRLQFSVWMNQETKDLPTQDVAKADS